MKIAYHDLYSIQLPDPHRFPMEKYELIKRQLIHEGVVDESSFFVPEKADYKNLLSCHDQQYVDRFLNLNLSAREQRKTGFVHTRELVERELIIMEGTKECARMALNEGLALNIAGGTHHAYRDRGEGFCMLNDQAIAARYLIDEEVVSKVMIIDLDVHQGNGTAKIFEEDDRVFTFSMHGKNNYPLHKEVSDRDVVLENDISDEEYLSILNHELKRLKEWQPDFVFYQCGVDVLKSDRLGLLGLSKRGVIERDELVFHFAKDLGVPVVCTMGGGYSARISDIVDAHVNTFKTAHRVLE